LSSSVKPWTTAIEIEHSCSVHPRNTDSILEFWKMIVHLTVMHDIFVSDNTVHAAGVVFNWVRLFCDDLR